MFYIITVIRICKNLIRLKYVDIKFLVMKEMVQNGQIFKEHIHSMFVDPLMDDLPSKVFHKHTI